MAITRTLESTIHSDFTAHLLSKLSELNIIADINDTIIGEDAANSLKPFQRVNKFFAEELPEKGEMWKDGQFYVKHGLKWEDATTTISFRTHVEKLVPGNPNDKDIKAKRQAYYDLFLLYLVEAGHAKQEDFIKLYNFVLNQITAKSIEAAGPNIFPSFNKMLDYLEVNETQHKLNLCSFGDELRLVADNFNNKRGFTYTLVEMKGGKMAVNNQLMSPVEFQQMQQNSSDHFAIHANYCDWANKNGPKEQQFDHSNAKPFVLDFSRPSIFFDDNAFSKKIINAILPFVSNEVASNPAYQRKVQDVLIQFGFIVPVNTLHAALGTSNIDKAIEAIKTDKEPDRDYFINCIKKLEQTYTKDWTNFMSAIAEVMKEFGVELPENLVQSQKIKTSSVVPFSVFSTGSQNSAQQSKSEVSVLPTMRNVG